MKFVNQDSNNHQRQLKSRDAAYHHGLPESARQYIGTYNVHFQHKNRNRQQNQQSMPSSPGARKNSDFLNQTDDGNATESKDQASTPSHSKPKEFTHNPAFPNIYVKHEVHQGDQ